MADPDLAGMKPEWEEDPETHWARPRWERTTAAMAARHISKMMGRKVSTRNAERATRIRKARPDLFDEVHAGRMTAGAAERQIMAKVPWQPSAKQAFIGGYVTALRQTGTDLEDEATADRAVKAAEAAWREARDLGPD